jgi:hypothetical protein
MPSERVNPAQTPEDEPHPMHPGEDAPPEGFHLTEGDAPTGEGYYEGEPGTQADEPAGS